MLAFNFISGDDFRRSLEADYGELEACAAAGAWKSVLVLAGSIVEAMLVDYLAATDYKARSGKDPLRLDLAQAVEACLSEGILSQRSADLCSAIRAYRNLIHPARAIRLGDEVDEEGARVAQALVGMIAKDVARKRQKTYGLTAEQLLSKLERDSSAIAILSHLLADTNTTERERFLLKVVPERFLELSKIDAAELGGFDEFSQHYDHLELLKTCFHEVLRSSGETTNQKVTAEFVRIVKEEGEYYVRTYGTAFFRALRIDSAEEPHRELLIRHVLSRLKDSADREVLQMADGVEIVLPASLAGEWLDPFIRRMAATSTSSADVDRLRNYLIDAFAFIDADVREAVDRRLKTWIRHFERLEQPAAVEVVSALRTALLASEEPGS